MNSQERLNFFLSLFTPSANCSVYGGKFFFFNDGDAKKLIIHVPSTNQTTETNWNLYQEGEDFILEMAGEKSIIEEYNPALQRMKLKKGDDELELFFISNTSLPPETII